MLKLDELRPELWRAAEACASDHVASLLIMGGIGALGGIGLGMILTVAISCRVPIWAPPKLSQGEKLK